MRRFELWVSELELAKHFNMCSDIFCPENDQCTCSIDLETREPNGLVSICGKNPIARGEQLSLLGEEESW